jgi:type III secretion protein T
VTTTGTILLLSGLSIFVIAGGLFAVVQLMYDSYKFWPVHEMAPPVDLDALIIVGKMMTLIFVIGMVVGGPALILMFALDLALAIANRLAPGIQLSDMSNAIKNMMVGLMIPLYGMFLVQYVKGDWQTMVAFLRSYLGVKGF